MDFNQITFQYNQLRRIIYSQCKKLNARIAVLGTKSSADILLAFIDKTDICIAGVYEKETFSEKKTFKGYCVRPASELSQLNPDDVVILASSAEATDLYDTFNYVQSICSCKIIHLKSLVDVYTLREELKEPLKFEYDEYLFGRGLFPLKGEHPYWQPKLPEMDFESKTVLELGPFEANNTVMLMSQKPKKVIALEARPINYAKISVIRSLYNWKNFDLVLGDMHLFPQLINEKIDIIFCSGVLYHSNMPWWLLKSCMDHCDSIILCGYIALDNPSHPHQTKTITLESGTYHFEVYAEFGWEHPLSGVGKNSLLFKEKDLVHFLNFHGFHFEKYDYHKEEKKTWIYSKVTKNNISA